MFYKNLGLFLVVPIIEIWILIAAGQRLGFGNTLGLLIILGLVGFFIVKRQGFAVIKKIRYETSQGHSPTTSVLDGLLILISGLLLLIPGLLTDFVGLSLLLFKPLRRITRNILKNFLINLIYVGKLTRFNRL